MHVTVHCNYTFIISSKCICFQGPFSSECSDEGCKRADVSIKYEKETSNVNRCFTFNNTFTANTTGLYEFYWTDFSGNENILTSLVVFTPGMLPPDVIAENCVQTSSSSSSQHAIVALEKNDIIFILPADSNSTVAEFLPAAKSRFSGKKLWCGCV